MDAKLINPFVDAFTTVMPMLGFPEPTRTKLYAATDRVKSHGRFGACRVYETDSRQCRLQYE